MIIIDSYKYRKYLLDLFPATVAYSLRKLRSGQAKAIRVRRSSDNAQQDIGFVGDELDTASLLSFCGVGNGFVTTWYDQSGNEYNATQTTQANQPQIVNSGVLNTKGGKAACVWTVSNSMLATVPTQDMAGIGYSFSVVADLTTGSPAQGLITNRVGSDWFTFGAATNYRVLMVESRNNGNSTDLYTEFNPAGQGNQVYSVVKTLSDCTIYRNGATVSSRSGNIGGGTTTFWKIGEWYVSHQSWLGTIQEIHIFYSSLPTIDRQSIERDQGAYYGITVI